MAISAVRVALETARVLDPNEIGVLEQEEKRLVAIHDSLLPAERPAHRHIERRLTELRRKREMLATAKPFGRLPMLDPNVLSWTKRQKMPFRIAGYRPTLLVPALAYLPVLSSSVQLSASWGIFHGVTSSGHIPGCVYRAYQEAPANFASVTEVPFAPDQIVLTYEYPGAVPREIKQMIANETRFAPGDLAFICEVDQWQVKADRRSIRQRWSDTFLDPILVGHNEGALWVLGSFDPTPVEQYMLDEFIN